MVKLRHPDRPGLHVCVVLAGPVVMGPGKAELLEGIRDTGSFAAAGRRVEMSYMRAWSLVCCRCRRAPDVGRRAAASADH